MTRAILAALTLTACSAQAAQQAPPCVVTMPSEVERIEQHSGESVTEAMLESAYGSALDGAPQ